VSADLRLIVLLVFLVVDAKAALDQHAIRLRARPLRDRDEAGRRRLNRGGLRRNVSGDAPVQTHLVLFVVVIGDLVLRAELRGHATRDAADVTVIDTGAAQVGDVPEG